MSTGLLNSLMNAQSQTATPAGQQMQVVMIPSRNIIQNPDNDEIYTIGNMDGLKDDIQQHGLRQPLEVIPVEGEPNCYMLISGHRRWAACGILSACGDSRFDSLPCLIRESHGKLDDRIALITANATARDLTDGERLAQYEALKDALTKKKAAGQLEGKVRDEVCRILGLSTGAAARLNVIASCENEIIKERLKAGEIGLMEAYRSAQDYARFMGAAPEEPEQKEEPAETVPKTEYPAWVLECAKEVCAFDWVKSAREFTAKDLIDAKGGFAGQSLKVGFVNYSNSKIRFWGSKYGDFTLTWAKFVKMCLENGIYDQNRKKSSLDAAIAVENKTADIQTAQVEQNRGMEPENAAAAPEKPENAEEGCPAISNTCIRGNNTLHKLAEKTLGANAAWELEWEDVRFRLAYYKQPLPGGATLWKRIDTTREDAGQTCDDYAIILQDNSFFTCGWIGFHSGITDILTDYFELK
nr:MAG TPA: chromosome partitioning protein [Caudoviricetes sp.]